MKWMNKVKKPYISAIAVARQDWNLTLLNAVAV